MGRSEGICKVVLIPDLLLLNFSLDFSLSTSSLLLHIYIYIIYDALSSRRSISGPVFRINPWGNMLYMQQQGESLEGRMKLWASAEGRLFVLLLTPLTQEYKTFDSYNMVGRKTSEVGLYICWLAFLLFHLLPSSTKTRNVNMGILQRLLDFLENELTFPTANAILLANFIFARYARFRDFLTYWNAA